MKFKLNDQVRYVGIDAEALNLRHGNVYVVTGVNPENTAIQVNNSGMLFKTSQFEIVKENRTMKFSNKPGSAIVTYDTGATFHISRLNTVEVFQNEGDVLINVTRTYTKDGLLFQQRVGIPVDKFVKLVWISPDNEEVVGQAVTVTYNKERNTLVYDMGFYADVIDFT